ncbi:MAG: aldo/keto reductase [delta proteobacterium ML8_F1]|nr:MAG: aldo/keto reductase [delta proteobacterium ML8_F1]
MNKRKLGNTGEEVSILGFGAMRFPLKADGTIDEKPAIEMIHYAIDQGVNYIDTAWPYHDGESEPFLGRALGGGYREKVYLATKLPSWKIKRPEDFEYFLDQQLLRLNTEVIDFYLVHAINKKTWHHNLLKNGLFSFLDRALASKKVKYVGFSFHDELSLFKEIVDAYPWSFTQIQFNYLDHDYQAGLKGLYYARDRGLGIIVMEPLRGGGLAGKQPADIAALWEGAASQRTPVQWALEYVWNYPQVDLVLSGMSSLEQVKENIEIASRATPNALTREEIQTVYAVKAAYLSRLINQCTTCGYCMPCPYEVNIPGAFKIFNDGHLFEQLDTFKEKYLREVPRDNRASQCVACGQCEPQCPQNISIIDDLKKVALAFESQ